MNIIRSSIESQVLDLKTLPIFSPVKRGENIWVKKESWQKVSNLVMYFLPLKEKLMRWYRMID